MKNNLRPCPTIILAVFLAMMFAILAFSQSTRIANSKATDTSLNTLPTPIPYSTDDGATFPISNLAMLTLGPSQVLRLTIVNQANSIIHVRFRRIEYSQGPCNNGACLYEASSHATSNPVLLGAGEAASFDIPNTAVGVRGVVLSNSRNVQVNAAIINSITGEIEAWVAPDTDVGTVR